MAGYLNRKGETAKTRMQCEKMIEVTPATKKQKRQQVSVTKRWK